MRMLSIVIVCAALSSPAAAQTTGGTIIGAVTDPTAAVVPGADVTIVNQDTGVARELVTNDKGFFRASNLVSGRYDVKASLSGFTTAVRKNLLVAVGQEVVADIQLQTGAVTEVAEVAARQAGVALSSSMLSNVVDGKTVRDLPINGRDWTMLAALEPGVHTIESQAAIALGSPNRGNRGWGTQMAVAGSRGSQNNYRLDGVTINDYSGSGPGSVLGAVLGVDSIEEFSVVTGNASAEYGRTSGGVINAVTRSGQNVLHGSAFEFLRNGALDARNFFDAGDKPPFDRHQFGGALGGPVRQDRTFFFVSYEGLRQNLSTTTVNTVPSRAAHNGQLANGTRVTVNPGIAPLLDLFPLPNGAESGDTGVFSFVGETTTDENMWASRVDHRLSGANSLRGTFMTDTSETSGPDTYNFVFLGQRSLRRLASIEDTHVFGPNVVNIARAGYSHSASLAPINVGTIDPRGADASLGFVPDRAVGGISISGMTAFLGGLDNTQTQHRYHSFQFYDDLLYTHNAHTFKLGVSVERIQANFSSASDSNGRFIFGSLDAFLQNRPTSFNASLPGANPTIYLRQTVFGLYAQDDYRVRSNLTLNLGLRYEMATVPTEKYDRLTNLIDLTSTQPRLGSPYFDNPTLLNFSPRLGFTWDPFGSGKTAVRGGFGIYDTLPLTYQFELLALNAAPFYRSGSATSLPQGSAPTAAFAGLKEDALRYSYIQPDPKRSYVSQWNVNVQRELPGSIVVQAGYVGQRGVHQPFRAGDTNLVVPTETDGQLTWPLPRGTGAKLNSGVGIINTLAWLSSTSYRGLNLQATRARGSQRLGLSYTWSKSTDTTSSSIASDFANSIQSPFLFFPEALRGPSDFDKRHNLVLNYLWEIPGVGGASGAARMLTHGWQLGGIFRAASGLPFSALIGGDALGQLNSNPFQFPDRLDTAECANPVNPGNPNHYIKTECFVAPTPTNRLGNSGRNTLTGPGLATLDLLLSKNTYIGNRNRFNIQFRAEAFNVLNRANFSVPDRTVSQVFNQSLAPLSAAGRLNSTSTTSRQIQFALKFIW
jgi:hypothetical protein